jgi:predicted nucleic acid-binding protein
VAGVIVLDASVLIAYLDGDDRHHGAAETLLAGAIDDDLGANPLTLAEVLVAPARDGRLEPTQTALRDLEVRELPFPSDAAVGLARLRAGTGLKMPDCCVLLAAEDSGATVATFDDRLAATAERRNLEVLGR